jgi:DNA-binding PadR family transcriptional regulator
VISGNDNMNMGDDPFGWGFGGRIYGHHRGPFRGFGLRYWVLSLVYEEPATGSMLMDKVERMTMGHWRPSPGQVYPLLEEMVSDGLLDVENKDGKKFYLTSSKGKDALDRSWFPWRTFGASNEFKDLDDAIKNMETTTQYILDNKEKIREKVERMSRIKEILGRLGEI